LNSFWLFSFNLFRSSFYNSDFLYCIFLVVFGLGLLDNFSFIFGYFGLVFECLLFSKLSCLWLGRLWLLLKFYLLYLINLCGLFSLFGLLST